MRTYVYGKPHDTRDLFEDYLDPGKTAIVSIDMHRGHLDASPIVPARRRGRATSSRRSTPSTTAHGRSAFRSFMCARCCAAAASTISPASRRRGGGRFRSMSAKYRTATNMRSKGRRWTEFVTRVAPERPDRRDQEAALGVLSDRSGFPAAQHAHRSDRAGWRLHRLLHSQHRVRRQQSQLSRHCRARSGARHRRPSGERRRWRWCRCISAWSPIPPTSSPNGRAAGWGATPPELPEGLMPDRFQRLAEHARRQRHVAELDRPKRLERIFDA